MEHIDWIVCLVLTILVLIVTAALAVLQGVSRSPRFRAVNTFRMLFAGVAIASTVLFIPFYYHIADKYDCNGFESFMLVLYNMIRLFLVNGEYDQLAELLTDTPQWLNDSYTITYAAMLILAPLMTFGFVLSFFKNLSAYVGYAFCYGKDTYIFSELNEQSLALATSLDGDANKKRAFVFTEVTDQEDARSLQTEARKLGAICFAKDITAVNFSFHSKKKQLHFFTIKEDESDNVVKALKLIDRYRHIPNTNLYAFSTGVEGEMLLTRAFEDKNGQPVAMKIRRINKIRSLIYRNLWDNGVDNVFRSAMPQDGIHHINALVVGMGQRGTEMLKALSWYGQMIGYRLTIHGVSQDTGAEDRFTAECPELMDPKLNHHFDIPGEMGLSITIHEDTDIHSAKFAALLKKLPPITYCFVDVGTDAQNIRAAAHLRSLFAGMKLKPVIQAVVENSDMNEALENVQHFSDQPYDIDFIGDTATLYSESVILCPDIEKEGLARHLQYGPENGFWRFDYNYNSSVASAIHLSAKKQLELPGIELQPEQRTDDDRKALRILEHSRWNAYMRSCGYVYGGSIERAIGRNDLAKRHNFLVTFDKLPPAEQQKDDA